ncbi:MAG: hypothetical protein Q9196_007442, partial [Gyalolechia fulgens]
MVFKFGRSVVIMGQLAQDAARTPPSEDGPPLEYVDRSLTILGRTFGTHNQQRRRESLHQWDFIASQLRQVESNMDGRFKEMEGKMDGRFKEMEDKMDGRFKEMEDKMDGRFKEMEDKMDGRFKQVDERFKQVDERFKQVDERFQQVDERFQQVDERFQQVDERFQQVDRRFDMHDNEFRDIKAQLANMAAITRNERLRRMHQPINLIKVLKPSGDHHKFVWAAHPQVPKHMKGTYTLGQRAKGVFEPSWVGKSNEQ